MNSTYRSYTSRDVPGRSIRPRESSEMKEAGSSHRRRTDSRRGEESRGEARRFSRRGEAMDGIPYQHQKTDGD